MKGGGNMGDNRGLASEVARAPEGSVGVEETR